MVTIAVNPFAKARHQHDTPYSHFDFSWDRLLDLTKAFFDQAEEGWRPGVLKVPVPCDGFWSPVVGLMPGDKLFSVFERRQPGEEPRKSTPRVEAAPKQMATHVKIVIYSAATLAEDGDRSSDADWEIIMVQASLTDKEPMHPDTLIANHYHLDGGTRSKMDAETFVEELGKSVAFWHDKAMVG